MELASGKEPCGASKRQRVGRSRKRHGASKRQRAVRSRKRQKVGIITATLLLGARKRQKVGIITATLLLCLCASCVYRLSNLHSPAPTKIALEAIYNTEARHIPHEHIWQAVQAMLARSGRLAAYHEAEQLLRVHLRDSTVSSVSAHAQLQLTAAVELWDLRQRKLLFSTTYRLDSTYQTVFAAEEVPRTRWFVQSEATRTAAVASIGAELARRVRRDLFVAFD